MQYEPDGAGTTDQNIVIGIDSLGYIATLDTFTDNHPFTPTAAKDDLLICHRPVIMGGTKDVGTINEEGHTWLCEGAEEVYMNRIFYFTENQPYGAGTFTQGMYSYNNPGDVGNVNTFVNFYMNWGNGQVGVGKNGWYTSNNVSTNYGNFKYKRSNIYVVKP